MTEIVIPAPSDSAGPVKRGIFGGRAKKGGMWLSMVVRWVGLALLMGFCFITIGGIAKTYTRIYPTFDARILDSEPARWRLSNYGSTQMVEYINKQLNERDGVLVFRMSDIAYYTDQKIAVYTDNHYAALFALESAEDLAYALIDEGFQFIALPPYGMAEVNNSVFGDLLADPELATPVFEAYGSRLFRISRVRVPVGRQRVRTADLSSPLERKKWQAARLAQPLLSALRTSPATFGATSKGQGIMIARDKPIVARKGLVDILQSSHLRQGLAPRMSGQSEFTAAPGTYTFQAMIAGEGEVKLYVELYAPDSSESIIERKLVWSGILAGERREISGQFVVKPTVFSFQTASKHYDARFYFTLRQGGALSVYNVTFDRLEDKASYQHNNPYLALARAHMQGWNEQTSTSLSGHDSFPRMGLGASGILSAAQASSMRFDFSSPNYLPVVDTFEVDSAGKLTATAGAIAPRVLVGMAISGRGALRQTLVGTCLDTTEEFTVSLPAASLTKTKRKYEALHQLPCIPSTLRIHYALGKDVFKTPPDLASGEVSISDLDIALQFWSGGEQLTQIDMVRSSEITSRSPAIEPEPLPVNTAQ